MYGVRRYSELSECLRQSADARGCIQPGAQGFVAAGAVERDAVDRNGAPGLAAVTDAGEDDGFAGMGGAPHSALVIGEHAVVVSGTLRGRAYGQPRHAILSLTF